MRTRSVWPQQDPDTVHYEFLKGKFRAELEAECNKKKTKERSSRPSWIPDWVTPEFGFRVCHGFALVTTILALSWTFTAVINGHLPVELWWKPMLLLKLGYPMLPVILLCWVMRYVRFDGISKTTVRKKRIDAGYYFANLKMGLLPSLGPGMLIGVVLDKIVVRPGSFGVARTFREFILPLAWIVGLGFWLVLETTLLRKAHHKEQTRGDWGNFATWYIDYNPKTDWRSWVKKGPHSMFGILDVPRHGTFHKVTQANVARVIGVTVCCILFWGIFLFEWVLRMSDEGRQWWTNEDDTSCTMMILRTDFCNLVSNTVTAPFLVWWVWREPHGEDTQPREDTQPLLPGNGGTDESAEKEGIETALKDFVEIVAALPWIEIRRHQGLSEVLLVP
jgi:hypothetical protein